MCDHGRGKVLRPRKAPQMISEGITSILHAEWRQGDLGVLDFRPLGSVSDSPNQALSVLVEAQMRSVGTDRVDGVRKAENH